MSYAGAVRYLLSLLGDIRSSHFGLERMQRLLEVLDHPEKSFRPIHLAGTNGKGSTAAMIESGLRAARSSTGLCTSPHLSRFNERVRLNGEEISDRDFAAAVGEVRAANERILASGGRQMHPTFFESVTSAAFCAFRTAGVEWGVVETGLGGRLDATNVLASEIAVITPVDLDHEAFLGKSLASIAAEKAGILHRGATAVIAGQSAEAGGVIERRARDLELPVIRAGVDWQSRREHHEEGRYRFEAVHYHGGKPSGKQTGVELSLLGEHQIGNALTAIAALDAAGAGLGDIRRGLASTNWPGRLEMFPGHPSFLIDSAHNPAGARVLARFAGDHLSGRRIILIYGSSRDKAVDEVAGLLLPLARRVIVTRSQTARSVSPEVLLTIIDHHHEDIRLAPSVAEAMQVAKERAQPDDIVLIAGSIFLAGEAREILTGR